MRDRFGEVFMTGGTWAFNGPMAVIGPQSGPMGPGGFGYLASIHSKTSISSHGAAKVRLGSMCAQGGLVACGFRAVWCPAPRDLNGIFVYSIDFCGKF